jgi:hypothetical protein
MDTTKAASAGIGIALAIGVLYNYGYFLGIDLNFFTFFTYKDHLTTLVQFAPPGLVMAFFFAAYRRKYPWLDQAAAFLAIVSIATWSVRDEAATLPSVNAFFFWFRGISSLFLIPYLTAVIVEFFAGDDWSKHSTGKQGIIGLCIIGLMVFMVTFGNFRRHTDVRGDQFGVEVTLASEDKTPSPPRPARMVRAIDDGFFFIFQDAPDRIAYVRKDGVKMLSRKVQK